MGSGRTRSRAAVALVAATIVVAGLAAACSGGSDGSTTATTVDPRAVTCSRPGAQGIAMPESFGVLVGYVAECVMFEAFPTQPGDHYAVVHSSEQLDEPIAWLWLECGLPEGVVPIGADVPGDCGPTATTVSGSAP